MGSWALSVWPWEPEISTLGEATGISKCYWYILSYSIHDPTWSCLWSFLGNQQSVCLQAVLFTKHFHTFLCPWGLANMLSELKKKHLQSCFVSQMFGGCIVYIVHMLSVYFCLTFFGALLCFLACHSHLYPSGMVWNKCVSLHLKNRSPQNENDWIFLSDKWKVEV